MIKIIIVIRNEFFGDKKPGSKISLECDEGEHDDVGADECEQKKGIVLSSGEFLQIESVVDEGDAGEHDGEDQFDGHASLSSLGVGVADLYSEKNESLVYPKDQTLPVDVDKSKIDKKIDCKQCSSHPMIELIPDNILIIPQKEQIKCNICK